jgi:hypothetical protein
MTMLRTLQEYLDAHHVGYQVTAHPIAYTAQEVARLQHIPGTGDGKDRDDEDG